MSGPLRTPRRGSFRRRLVLLSLVTSASTLLLAAVLFSAHAVREYRERLTRELVTEAEIIGLTVSPALVFRDERAAAEALAALRAEPQLVAARIFTADGLPFASYLRPGAPAGQLPAQPGLAGRRLDRRGRTFELTRPIGEPRRPLGTLYLRADLADLEKRIRGYAQITGAVLAVSLLVALGGAFILQRGVSRPVLALVDTAQRVAAGRDYSLRATVQTGGELGVLVEAFNHMLGEIEQRDERLRAVNHTLRLQTEELARKNEEVEAFVYIVSHDLRAPLVNLQGFSRELQLSCDDLRKRLAVAALPPALDAAVQQLTEVEIPSSLRFISASTAKFERLINALLQLSRSGRRELRPEDLDMHAVVDATLDSLRRILDDSGAEVVVGSLPPAHGDATAIGQLLSNLLTNAVRYLQPGRPGRIELAGARAGELNQYSVSDNGVGIPESALRKLFQVFQRFRPDLAAGEGIGLATVKRIVERHGGSIWAESVEGVGTTFHFTLPAAGAAAGGQP